MVYFDPLSADAHVMPRHLDEIARAVPSDDVAPGPWALQIVRVPYDIERALAEARAVAMPGYAALEFELTTAQYRGAMDRVE